MTRRPPPPPGVEALLAAILRGVPHLPGAHCRGRPELFDETGQHESPEVAQQRHNQAVGLCEHCPALSACEQWCAGLKPNHRPSGVVAGRIRGARGTPGRPRTTPPQADNDTHGKAAS